MLGKLLKYELKAGIWYYIIMSAAVFAVTLACCGTMGIMIKNEADNPFITLSAMSVVMLYIVVLVAAGIFTPIIVFKRFYSHNFSQEGYLTFTLPVTAKQIYWSKFMTSLLWYCWTYLLIILSFVALIITLSLSFDFDLSFLQDVFGSFTEIFDNSILMIILYVLNCLISIVYGICIIYLSICIGQNFNVHRVIAAIGSYFVVGWIINLISSVLSTTVVLIIEVVSEMQSDYGVDYNSISNMFEIEGIVTLIIQIVIYVAAIVGAYIYSIRKMSKGLNLK